VPLIPASRSFVSGSLPCTGTKPPSTAITEAPTSPTLAPSPSLAQGPPSTPEDQPQTWRHMSTLPGFFAVNTSTKSPRLGNGTHARGYGRYCYPAHLCTRHCPTQVPILKSTYTACDGSRYLPQSSCRGRTPQTVPLWQRCPCWAPFPFTGQGFICFALELNHPTILSHILGSGADKCGGFSGLSAMNGKTVEVDNTDAEGRLILSGESFNLTAPLPVADNKYTHRCSYICLARVQTAHSNRCRYTHWVL
jgi:hypothetical protein